MSKYCVASVIALAVSGCASNVEVAYPSPSSPSQTGVVLIRFTESMRAVSVRIDGFLVAEDQHTERVRIASVPAGVRQVTVVASADGRREPVDRTERVSVGAGEEVAILVATPPRSIGYWIYSAVSLVVFGALLFASDID